jgi:hypothetical protein
MQHPGWILAFHGYDRLVGDENPDFSGVVLLKKGDT